MRAKCALENPRGSLEKREYMDDCNLLDGVKKDVLDQCPFGRDYRKTTHIWNDIAEWSPVGCTGDGRCHGKCGKGEVRNGYFRHFKALAMEPCRGPRGKGHVKEKNALPGDLLREIGLSVCKDSSNESDDTNPKVILDLCSGFQIFLFLRF